MSALEDPMPYAFYKNVKNKLHRSTNSDGILLDKEAELFDFKIHKNTTTYFQNHTDLNAAMIASNYPKINDEIVYVLIMVTSLAK